MYVQNKPYVLCVHQEDGGFVRKKREYKKRKHKQASQQSAASASLQQPAVQIPQYSELDSLQQDAFSSEEEGLSPVRHRMNICCVFKIVICLSKLCRSL